MTMIKEIVGVEFSNFDIFDAEPTCTFYHKIWYASGIHKIITKTRLFKYIENFTTKNWKFSDKNSNIFSTFLLKT